jgi:hypothetical protein
MTAATFNKLIHDKATETSVMFAKMQCAGHYTAIEKSGWSDIINRHATALFGDASPRNFTKCITENEEGRLFYQALKFAQGSEIKPQPIEKDDGPVHIGPAHAKMHSLAVDRQRERTIRWAAAYSEVYNAPANAALRAEVQREHLEHALAGIHGGVDHTLSTGEAQRKEPAKDFTNVGDFGRAIARKNAEKRLQELADARHADHPEESPAISYTKILTDAKHAELRKAALVA